MVLTMLKGFRKPDHVAGSAAPAIIMSVFVSFGGILFGYDTGNINGLLAMRQWRKHFSTGYIDPKTGQVDVSPSQSSQIVSILSAGTFFGSLLAAPLGDKLGRRPSLILATAIFVFGVTLQISASKIPLFVAGRFFAGLGVGLVSVLVPLYQSEMSPKWIRGTLVCMYQLAITVGLLIASIVNNFASAIPNTAAYRVPISIQFVWALVLLLGLCLLPETPRYLIKTNQHAEAALSLSRLRRLDITHPALIEELAEIEANHSYELSLGPSKYIDCLTGSPHLGRRLLTGCGLQMLQQLCGCNFIFYYGTTFFDSSGIKSPFIISLITNVVNVLSTFLSLSLVESWGRRRLLMIGAIGMSVCLFVVASVGTTVGDSSESASNIVLVTFVCIFIFFFASSWGPVAWVVTSEIYPLKVRAKSMSITTASNWLLNWGLAYSTPYLVGTGAGYANLKTEIFYVWGGASVIAIFFVYAMVYETSKISLEQIDELYERVDRAWNSKGFQPQWSFQNIRDESEGVSGGAMGVELQNRERRATVTNTTDNSSDRGSSSGSALSAISTQQSREEMENKIFPMANVDFEI